MTKEERALIADGKKFRKKERDELIDNCHRSGTIHFNKAKNYSTKTLKEMYLKRLKNLGYQT